MIKDYVTVTEVAEILDIYEVSALELVDGVIPFEAIELVEIAQATGIAVDELIK